MIGDLMTLLVINCVVVAGIAGLTMAAGGSDNARVGRDAEGGIDTDGSQARSGKPQPDVKDFPYGPHFRNSFDLYLAKSDRPTPLLIWIHGGAFLHGDKAGVPAPLLKAAMEAGISVASINYRLSQQAPFPALMHDAARALQYLRFDAGRWNLDRKRFICAGSSAGGGISLWLAFHPDLADPNSTDMVEWQSSRPNMVTGIDTQCSYDPHFIRRIIPGAAGDNRGMKMLFRVRAEDFDADWAKQRFAEGSAINFATADAPPIFLFYRYRDVRPTDKLPAGHAIHHPIFGQVLKEKLDAMGVPCELSGADMHPEMNDAQLRETYAAEAVAFIRKHFPLKQATPSSNPGSHAAGQETE